MITAIIVNFNAGAFLRRAVDSVLAQDAGEVEILVVDNGSRDNSLATLEENPRLRLIEGGGNLGFARACNRAIDVARGARLLFLNPDCRLFDGALSCLARALDGHPGAAMAGPRLINPDGSDQRGARREIPNPWRIFCIAIGLHRMMPNHPRFRDFNRQADPLPERPVEVPAISGACMLVERDAIEAVGTLDEGFFLHFEDLDWCHRFNLAGRPVLFAPDATCEHVGGVCAAHAPFRVAYHKHRSLIRFLRKHFAAFYPRPFMALVAALVWLRLAVVLPRVGWQRLRRPTTRRGH